MPPNVLLVVLDAARARNIGLYGHGNDTMPYLSTLGERATVYTQARSPSTWSLPSHTSMFTGLEVPEHGVVSRNDRLASGHTVWEDLQQRGYDTGVFSHNPFITAESYGLSAGFDTVVTDVSARRYPFPSGTDPTAFIAAGGDEDDYLRYLRFALEDGTPVRSLANAVLRQLERVVPSVVPASLGTRLGNESEQYASAFLDWQRGRSDWAACINLTDAHHPYVPTDPYDQWGGETLQRIHDSLADPRWDFYSGREPWWKRRALTGLYDGCLRQTDAAIETIIETLSDRDELDDTAVVITADHGEGFGERSRVRPEHRVVGHAGGIHESLLHVPLVTRVPGQTHDETVRRAATVRRFPAAVERVLDGDGGDEDGDDGVFVPDGPVVSVSDVGSQFETPPKNFEQYSDEMDTTLFSGIVRAVYRDRDGSVRKFAQWGEHGAVVDVYDAQAVTSRPDVAFSTEKEVTDVFKSYTDEHVREATTDDVGEGLRRRLKDLGYM